LITVYIVVAIIPKMYTCVLKLIDIHNGSLCVLAKNVVIFRE